MALMYLVVPQLKSRQIEIKHGCFLPSGRRPQEVVTFTKNKKDNFGADPPAQ